MNLSLQNKHALVCGSTQGIGLAIAKELSLLGAHCTLLARNETALKTVVEQLDRSQGQQHNWLVADFSKLDELKNVVQEFSSRQTIHILVNNTGGPPPGPIVNASAQDFLSAFSQHIVASQELVQLLLPGMKREQYGRIINIISTSVRIPLANLGVSNTIRAAMASWAKTMSNELGAFGITVNNVLPGLTRTQRLQSLIEHISRAKDEEVAKVESDMQKEIPARRFGEASEIAAMAAFLATPAAAYVNGATIPVDGGKTGQHLIYLTLLNTVMSFENSRSFAISMDEADELSSFRDRFLLPSHGNGQPIYMLGNSLGLQPRETRTYINEILNAWQDFGVEGFFMGAAPWLEYHEKLARPLAAMVGAAPDEIVVMNQLTVNLHLMMASFYKPQGRRRKIICEAKAFPSDQYLLESQCRFHGLDPDETIIEVSPREGEELIREEDILDAIRKCNDELALVLWGGVNYYTGQYFDLKSLSSATHAVGALLGLDLAHAVGNLPLSLAEWDPDFACWCNYKYVNAGPGSIAAAFIPRRYHDSGQVRLAGWWGYDKATRFKMEKGFVPMQSAEGWQLSTPSPILYASLRASLEIFEEAGMQKLREKSLRLTDYLFYLLNELKGRPVGQGMKVLTPVDPEKRGCQVSLLFEKNGRAIYDALTKEGIFVDWREPNVIRLAPVPLYNKFEEVWKFCDLLGRIV